MCDSAKDCGCRRHIIIPEFSLVNDDIPDDELFFEHLKYFNTNQLEFYSISDNLDENGMFYQPLILASRSGILAVTWSYSC